MIDIFTDGSCKGNPGPGGWAAIIIKKNESKDFTVLKGGAKDTTNNRMEMIAVIEALRYIQENNLLQFDYNLFSDSNLIVQTINKGWKRKANLDLWQEMDKLNEEISVKYFWIKGHAKNKWNEQCDKIACEESEKFFKILKRSHKEA